MKFNILNIKQCFENDINIKIKLVISKTQIPSSFINIDHLGRRLPRFKFKDYSNGILEITKCIVNSARDIFFIDSFKFLMQYTKERTDFVSEIRITSSDQDFLKLLYQEYLEFESLGGILSLSRGELLIAFKEDQK